VRPGRAESASRVRLHRPVECTRVGSSRSPGGGRRFANVSRCSEWRPLPSGTKLPPTFESAASASFAAASATSAADGAGFLCVFACGSPPVKKNNPAPTQNRTKIANVDRITVVRRIVRSLCLTPRNQPSGPQWSRRADQRILSQLYPPGGRCAANSSWISALCSMGRMTFTPRNFREKNSFNPA